MSYSLQQNTEHPVSILRVNDFFKGLELKSCLDRSDLWEE